MTLLLAYCLGSFAAGLALVPVCRLLAFRFGLVAQPKQDRWHKRPTPLLGGVAIALPPLIGSALLLGDASMRVALIGCAGMFLVGLADDVRQLKPSTKLVAEIAFASLLMFFGYRLDWVESNTLDALLTLVWLVGITNGLNLLDNMDGLCAGIAAIAALALLAGIYPVLGASASALWLAMVAGSTVAFLLFNFHPARIFMGDSGSLFLGLALATVALQLPHDGGAASSVLSVMAAPLLVLLVPIFDTTLVTLSRLSSGRRPSQGGRDHSSHRLVAIGLPERTAVFVLWALAGLGGAAGLALQDTRQDSSFVAAVLFVLAMIVFAAYLARVRVYEEQDSRLHAGGFTLFVVDVMHKRRIFEVLLDVTLVAIAYYSAYRIRFEALEYSEFFPTFLSSLPLVLGVQMLAFFAVGVYRGMWKLFGLMDAVVLAKGVLIGTLVQVVLILYLYRFEHYSRGVFIIYAALLLLFIGGSRASFRLISEFVGRRRQGRRLLVYGAGSGGALVTRELLTADDASYRMLGFIDDDPDKRRMRVQGYPVLGGFDSLVSLVSGGAVDSVIISTRLMDVDRLKELERLCGQHGVTLQRLHFRLEPITAAS